MDTTEQLRQLRNVYKEIGELLDTAIEQLESEETTEEELEDTLVRMVVKMMKVESIGQGVSGWLSPLLSGNKK